MKTLLPFFARAALWLISFVAFVGDTHATVTNVAWYRLGENDPGAASGQAVNNPTMNFVGANHLRRLGSPRYTNDVSGAAEEIGSTLAVQFNGANQFCSNAVVTTARNNFGIEAWVKVLSGSEGTYLVAHNGNAALNGWGLQVDVATGPLGDPLVAYAGELGGGIRIGSGGSRGPGFWTHLALVRDNGTSRFYLNGAATSGTSTATPATPAGAFAIAANPQSLNGFFPGVIDEVRVFTFAPGQFSTDDLLVNQPLVTTLPASGLAPGTATLNGRASSLGFPTTVWFEWGVSPNLDNMTPPQALGSSFTTANFSEVLTGLTAGLTYRFRAVGTNNLGIVFGSVRTFIIGPTVETLPATALTQTAATLNGLVNPKGTETSAWFEYGFTTNYGFVTPPQALGSLDANTNFSETLTALIPGLGYHFRAVASNSFGVGFGADQSLTVSAQADYLKASDTSPSSGFGRLVAMSGDTLVVAGNGAYVFVREGSSWEQQAHLTDAAIISSVAISGDTLVIGDAGDDNSGTNTDAGAAHVYVRSGTTWTRQAILRKSNPVSFEEFGRSVTISGDTIVVGVPLETHSTVPYPHDPFDPNLPTSGPGINAGTAYVFVRNGTNWSQQAFLRSDNIVLRGQFGSSVAVAGNTIAVGELHGQSTILINGTSFVVFGTAHVFVRNGINWSQQATLLPSNGGSGVEEGGVFAIGLDEFGASIAILDDTIVVGSPREDSNATGVNGSGANDLAVNAGAAYVYVRSGTNWTQQAYLKASNTGTNDFFGASVAVSGDRILIGAAGEDSNARNVNGDGANNLAPGAGAAYLFARQGATWSFLDYLKASNTESNDAFGVSVAASADLLVVGASGEDSNDVGLNGDQDDNSATNSGAVYIFGPPRLPAPEITVSHSGNLLTGASLPQMIAAVGNSATRGVTIKNSGNDFLTGLIVTFDGPDAAMFNVAVPPVAPLTPTSNTTFIVRFAPTSGGTKTATLRIASNDENENPFDIQLNDLSLSFTEDRDGDGLNDASELLMAPLGFNFQASQTSLVNTLFNNANGAGLFTPAQLQALNVESPLLAHDPSTGLFKLTIGVEKAADLTNFFPFPMNAAQTIINAEGKLEFQFSSPDRAAFFRLESR